MLLVITWEPWPGRTTHRILLQLMTRKYSISSKHIEILYMLIHLVKYDLIALIQSFFLKQQNYACFTIFEHTITKTLN